ncbi:MAG: hypothetical protein ACRDD9_23515 [Shewanella sp.]
MRESGWYRVKIGVNGCWELAEYFSGGKYWEVTNYDGSWSDIEFNDIDPQMVMTPEGQIVYNQQAHDPLYNTKQEG